MYYCVYGRYVNSFLFECFVPWHGICLELHVLSVSESGGWGAIIFRLDAIKRSNYFAAFNPFNSKDKYRKPTEKGQQKQH